MSDKPSCVDRATAKDVLHAIVRWKSAIDAQPQTGATNISPISKELYAVVDAWLQTVANDAIEREVFDDPHGAIDDGEG